MARPLTKAECTALVECVDDHVWLVRRDAREDGEDIAPAYEKKMRRIQEKLREMANGS